MPKPRRQLVTFLVGIGIATALGSAVLARVNESQRGLCRDAPLVFHETDRVSYPDSLPAPTRVLHTVRFGFVAFSPVFGAYQIRRDAPAKRLLAPGEAEAITTDGNALYYIRGSAIKVLENENVPAKVVVSVPRDRFSKAVYLDKSAEGFWFTVVRTDSTYIYKVEAGRPIVRKQVFGGTWRVQGLGPESIALWSAHPKDGVRILSFGSIHLKLPDTLTQKLPPLALPVNVSGLEDGCYIETIADLQSDQRWIVVFKGNRILRVRKLTTPLGIVETKPTQRTLLAFNDEGGRRSIVTYSYP